MAEVVTKVTADDRDREEARKGANLLGRAEILAHGGLFLTDANGKHVLAEMSASLLRAVHDFLDAMSMPGETLVFKTQDEVSPERAAEMLGISRPIVYRRMDTGRLPFRQVGSHRRIRVSDVAELKQFEDTRRKFAAELSEDTEDLEANYAQPGPGSP